MTVDKFKDVVGERFGRLVVLGEKHTPGISRRVTCICDCEKLKEPTSETRK